MVATKNDPRNHPGAIIRWPILKVNENDFDPCTNPIIKWEKDILLEPADAQILVTFKHGLTILSHGQYPLVEIVDANLWNKDCEDALKIIYAEHGYEYNPKEHPALNENVDFSEFENSEPIEDEKTPITEIIEKKWNSLQKTTKISKLGDGETTVEVVELTESEFLKIILDIVTR